MKTYYLALDLKEDEALIKAYDEHHKNVWPEIKESITSAGVENMEIYRTGNRLFMVVEVVDSFTFENKAAMDANNPKVQEWEQLMRKYQKKIPTAEEGTKWVLLHKIFQL